jgi:type IV secretory pathway VirB10-like protein
MELRVQRQRLEIEPRRRNVFAEIPGTNVEARDSQCIEQFARDEVDLPQVWSPRLSAHQITAQITENLYDTPTGRVRLVPQGARLIGIYDSQVAFGQSRVLLVWTRLIMPNGRSIVLERQPGADAGGYAGVQDEVDNHWLQFFKAAALSTLLSVGTELGSGGNDSDIIQALRRGAGDSLNQTGQQIVRRNLNIQPTLTIRPGFPVRVIVNRDLVLEPYKG